MMLLHFLDEMKQNIIEAIFPHEIMNIHSHSKLQLIFDFCGYFDSLVGKYCDVRQNIPILGSIKVMRLKMRPPLYSNLHQDFRFL